ncbi:MAG: hypothetical protein AAGA34_07425 [Pseudomonadota bacterium]
MTIMPLFKLHFGALFFGIIILPSCTTTPDHPTAPASPEVQGADQEKRAKADGSDYALLVAALAFLVAFGNALETARRDRRARAQEAWREYLRFCFDYPIYALPQNYPSFVDYESKKVCGSVAKFEKYEWFVWYLVNCALSMKRNYPFWSPELKAVKTQLSFHNGYWQACSPNILAQFPRSLESSLDAASKEAVRRAKERTTEAKSVRKPNLTETNPMPEGENA